MKLYGHPTDRFYHVERFHRMCILLFAPVYFALLPFLLTAALAWRSRHREPRRRWWWFSVVSVAAATAAALAWALLPNPWLAAPSLVSQVVLKWASAYVVFSLVLLPHTAARVAARLKAGSQPTAAGQGA